MSRLLNIILTAHLCVSLYSRPRSHVKEVLARSIVEEFPELKGDVGIGYVSIVILAPGDPREKVVLSSQIGL